MKIARRSTEVEKSLICQGSTIQRRNPAAPKILSLFSQGRLTTSGGVRFYRFEHAEYNIVSTREEHSSVASKSSVGSHLVGRSLRRWLPPASTPDKTPMAPWACHIR